MGLTAELSENQMEELSRLAKEIICPYVRNNKCEWIDHSRPDSDVQATLARKNVYMDINALEGRIARCECFVKASAV